MLRRHTGQRYFDESQEDQRLRVGLVGHWVGDGAGLTLRDRSGYQNHGTFSGGTSFGLGHHGMRHSVLFDGTDDICTTVSNPIPSASMDFTCSLWLRPVAFTAYHGAVTNHVAERDDGFNIARDDGNAFFSMHFVPTANPTLSFPSIIVMVWHHYVVVKRGTLFSLYFDGYFVTSATYVTGAYSPATVLRFGTYRVAAEHYYNGAIDDPRIYNRALSGSEIARLADPSRRLTAMGRRGRLVPVSVIKTRDGLARSSVKTWNGLADASVKTWNGIA